MFLELGFGEREGQARADQRQVALEPEQVRNRADVIFVAVCEDDADDVIEAVLEGLEVGKDEVHSRLVLFGEEHAAVHDEDLAVELEDRHVAADLAEAPQRDDAKRPRLERGRGENGVGHATPIGADGSARGA